MKVFSCFKCASEIPFYWFLYVCLHNVQFYPIHLPMWGWPVSPEKNHICPCGVDLFVEKSHTYYNGWHKMQFITLYIYSITPILALIWKVSLFPFPSLLVNLLHLPAHRKLSKECYQWQISSLQILAYSLHGAPIKLRIIPSLPPTPKNLEAAIAKMQANDCWKRLQKTTLILKIMTKIRTT